MSDRRAPADVEAWGIAYLTPVTAFSVSDERGQESSYGTEMVKFSSIGGPGIRDKIFDDALLLLEVWAADTDTAFVETAKLVAYLHAWPEEDPRIEEVSCSHPISLEDPASQSARYTSTVQVTAFAPAL